MEFFLSWVEVCNGVIASFSCLCPCWCVVTRPAVAQEDEDARVELLLLEPRWQDSHPHPGAGRDRTGRSRLDLVRSIFPAGLKCASRHQAAKATVTAAQPVFLFFYTGRRENTFVAFPNLLALSSHLRETFQFLY